MINAGHCVREMKVGNTRIKICDDCCRDKTPDEVRAILERIARNAQDVLSAAASTEATKPKCDSEGAATKEQRGGGVA